MALQIFLDFIQAVFLPESAGGIGTGIKFCHAFRHPRRQIVRIKLIHEGVRKLVARAMAKLVVASRHLIHAYAHLAVALIKKSADKRRAPGIHKFFRRKNNDGDLLRRKNAKERTQLVVHVVQIFDRVPGFIAVFGAIELDVEMGKLLAGKLGFNVMPALFPKI